MGYYRLCSEGSDSIPERSRPSYSLHVGETETSKHAQTGGEGNGQVVQFTGVSLSTSQPGICSSGLSSKSHWQIHRLLYEKNRPRTLFWYLKVHWRTGRRGKDITKRFRPWGKSSTEPSQEKFYLTAIVRWNFALNYIDKHSHNLQRFELSWNTHARGKGYIFVQWLTYVSVDHSKRMRQMYVTWSLVHAIWALAFSSVFSVTIC